MYSCSVLGRVFVGLEPESVTHGQCDAYYGSEFINRRT